MLTSNWYTKGGKVNHSQASDNVFNQWNQTGGNLKVLAEELTQLREELVKKAKGPEQLESATAIAKAEAAAKGDDGPTAFRLLKEAGKWALDIAKSIGIPITVEVLKKTIGL
jgi:hypothetical protein